MRFVLVWVVMVAGGIALADPPRLVIPVEVRAIKGDWLVIQPDTDAKAVSYVGLDGLAAFPSSELKDSRKLIVNPPADGRYRFVAVGSLNDEHARAAFTIVVGDSPTPAPPVPPGPQPDPTPTPAPIPVDGLRVLIVYETSQMSALSDAQRAILQGKRFRDFVETACVKVGKEPERRFWDKDVNTTNESKLWQDAMKRSRQSIPWIVVSNGKTGFEGPLPATVDETIALISKYK